MSTDVSVATSTATTNPAAPLLPSDLAVCHSMIVELLDALAKEQRQREGLQQRLDQLLRRLYGPKAERFDPNQPWLLPELANADTNGATPVSPPPTETNEATTATAKPKRPGHGRTKLPESLPRRRIEHRLFRFWAKTLTNTVPPRDDRAG